MEAAFPDPWIRQFSIKANDVPAIIAELAGLGLGANVVSRGEWARARRAWLPNESITLEGVGKTDADLRAAVSAARRGDPLRWVAVESPEEAEALATFAQGAHVTLDVLFRLNPDVAPETQAGLAVGSGASKFGMTETELTRTVQRLAVEPGRFLVARAGWIVARVLHVRDRGARLAVIDAGMAELVRPALYGAVHPVVALTSRGEPVDDAGPAASLVSPAHGW